MCADCIPELFYFDKRRARAVVLSLHSPSPDMKRQMLGGLTARDFLARYWQKRPLFVRGALPGFRGLIDRRDLEALATRDDVESRIVERARNGRATRHGPFARVTLKK